MASLFVQCLLLLALCQYSNAELVQVTDKTVTQAFDSKSILDGSIQVSLWYKGQLHLQHTDPSAKVGPLRETWQKQLGNSTLSLYRDDGKKLADDETIGEIVPQHPASRKNKGELIIAAMDAGGRYAKAGATNLHEFLETSDFKAAPLSSASASVDGLGRTAEHISGTPSLMRKVALHDATEAAPVSIPGDEQKAARMTLTRGDPHLNNVPIVLDGAPASHAPQDSIHLAIWYRGTPDFMRATSSAKLGPLRERLQQQFGEQALMLFSDNGGKLSDNMTAGDLAASDDDSESPVPIVVMRASERAEATAKLMSSGPLAQGFSHLHESMPQPPNP